MSIFSVVKTGINAILNTQSHQDSQELRYLRELHERQTGTTPKTWYRVVNPLNELVGFCYVCNCGTSYELLNVGDWLGKKNTCGCGHEFDLFKSLGIPAGTEVSDHPKFFAKLALTPRLTQTKPPTPCGAQIGYWGDNDPTQGASDWGGDKAAAERADINRGLF